MERERKAQTKPNKRKDQNRAVGLSGASRVPWVSRAVERCRELLVGGYWVEGRESKVETA